MEALRAAIARGRLPHAYLFTGPPHIGKSTLARWLAQALLCERRQPGEGEPCGECSACARVARGTHPDVQTYGLARQAQASDRATASRELGIDTVRELVGEIDLLPFEAERKVYIIEDADTLTEEAANGLLKTLEEPPAYATLVLVAVDDSNLPATIRSRCTPLKLHPVAPGEMEELLRSRTQLPPDAVARIAALSAGRPGWALTAAADPAVLETHDANVAALLDALRAGAAGRLALAERLGKRWTAGHRQEVYDALFDWLGFWRAVMLAEAGNPAGAAYPAHEAEIARLSAQGTGAAGKAAARVLEAVKHLDANVNTRMAVETLLLDLP
jgi:DNA polymerase-3 subunit delta'